MKLVALPLTAVLCALLMQQITALKCVNCHFEITAGIKSGTKDCDEPFVAGNTTECTTGQSCFVTKSNTTLIIHDYRLTRGCKTDCTAVDKTHHQTTCCTTDLCNSGVTYTSSTAASCLGLILATLFTYYY